jgi:hypothetical protein
MQIHHSAGEFHGRKAIFNDAGRLATVDPDSHNAVVDSGLFRKILVRIELKRFQWFAEHREAVHL